MQSQRTDKVYSFVLANREDDETLSGNVWLTSALSFTIRLVLSRLCILERMTRLMMINAKERKAVICFSWKYE